MGQQQSRDELLYRQVNYGNVDGIKALHSQGASLEWIDSEGKTALILACMDRHVVAGKRSDILEKTVISTMSVRLSGETSSFGAANVCETGNRGGLNQECN